MQELGRGVGGEGSQDPRAAGQSCISLAADGRDARGVRTGSRRASRSAQPRIPIVSNLTGETLLRRAGALAPRTGCRHVRETVRFAAGARWLGAQGVGSFLELGPDGVLSAMTRECLATDSEDERAGAADQAPSTAVALLRRGRPEARTLLAALARAWVHGAAVDWSAAFAGTGARLVELPTYAFQREALLDGLGAGLLGGRARAERRRFAGGAGGGACTIGFGGSR